MTTRRSTDPVEGQGLLDLGDLAVPTPRHADDTPTTTPGQRRLARQMQVMRAGQHPLVLSHAGGLNNGLKLHADAADPVDREAPGLRCGSCRLRLPQVGGSRDYPKCAHPDPVRVNWSRATHGGGSDVAAWWPACVDYQAKPTT